MNSPDVIQVLVVDDHPVVRVGLRSLLDAIPDIKVVGEASTGAETLVLARRLRPDLVLLDLRLPDMNGLEVCRQLKDTADAPSVIFLTSYAEDASVIAAITAGADGYLLKDVDGGDLPGAIRRVAAGGTALDPVSARALATAVRQPAAASAGSRPWEGLSAQECKVLNLVAEGRTNKQVSELLRLTEGTVKNYLATIFDKLGVKNRTEAVVLWLKTGMAPESQPSEKQPPPRR